jgi:radical SAM superfamily enzyme YgiQ (UPF0313 family)
LRAKEYSKVYNEDGMIIKNHGGKLRIGLVFPNSYRVGMANLAIHSLYRWFNSNPEIVCERYFLPDVITNKIPRTIETNAPLADMDVIAFTLSYELDALNIVRILQMCGIPPLVNDRTKGPLIIAGGAVAAYNPHLISSFCDAVLMGDAEPVIDELMSCLIDGKDVSEITGMVNTETVIDYKNRQVEHDLDRLQVYSSVYCEDAEFSDMGLIEIGRGCPYGCRFCVASHCFRPARWRSFNALMPAISEMSQYKKKIGLVGASVTDHPQILQICERLLSMGLSPSPASMRADALTMDLLELLVRGGTRSITLAPEAGNESLRRKAGKTVTDDALISACIRAKQAGINSVKMYFIVGLPGENDDDIRDIATLTQKIMKESGMRLSAGCSIFIPKPGTPWANEKMVSISDAKKKLSLLKSEIHGVTLTTENPREAEMQGILSSGGTEISNNIIKIANAGKISIAEMLNILSVNE